MEVYGSHRFVKHVIFTDNVFPNMLHYFYSGMLPEAVLPPSDEHSYAQWLKKQDRTIKRPEGDHENLPLKSQGKYIYGCMAYALLLFVSCLFIFFLS